VSRQRAARVVVHVIAERFRRACQGPDVLDPLALTAKFDEALRRHASGWRKESADEALLVGECPWGQSGQWGSPMDWANGLRTDVARETRLDCSIGIAATRVAARICSRMARPRGILLWLEGHESTLIADRPLEDLDELRPDQLARLRARRIRTLGQLADLGSGEARLFLGGSGEGLLRLVRGDDRMPDETRDSRLSRAARLLARRLSRRLSRQGRSARGLELSLVYADGATSERYLLLARATSLFEEILEAALRLVEMHPRRKEQISDVALTATGLIGLQGRLDLPGVLPFARFGEGSAREVSVRLGPSDAVR
jgi:nucleotidyltransferase/DNA polymerase involved in DNA repair